MKKAIWVAVYFAVCFLVFSGWVACFAQHAPFNGHGLTLMYLYDLFYVYVFMEPFYQFFQVTNYVKGLVDLADNSGQLINFYKEIPVMWIYSLSAVITSVIYLIYTKWFVRKRVQR